MLHIARLDQLLFVLVHEFGPAFGHNHDLKIRLMFVPAGSRFWCPVRLHKVRDDLDIGRLGDAQITLQEKVAQSARHKLRVGRLDVRKTGFGAFEHGLS